MGQAASGGRFAADQLNAARRWRKLGVRWALAAVARPVQASRGVTTLRTALKLSSVVLATALMGFVGGCKKPEYPACKKDKH